jgi:hypothetical protein
MVRLDHALPDQTIDVLKIDVEGADTWVLQGCETLLEQKRVRHIFFEQNEARMKPLGIGRDEAVTFLRSVGYAYEQPEDLKGEWFAYPSEGSARPTALRSSGPFRLE